VEGYCVRCRTKQNMLNATRTFMKNRRRAMLGLCECCGTKMCVAGKWDSDATPPDEPAEELGANDRAVANRS
jgi:hypothetical protein